MAQCFWSFPLTFYSSDKNASPLAMWESLIIVFREKKKKSVAQITSPGSSNWLCCGSEVCLGCKSQQAQSGAKSVPRLQSKLYEETWEKVTNLHFRPSLRFIIQQQNKREIQEDSETSTAPSQTGQTVEFCVVLRQDKILMSNIISKKKKNNVSSMHYWFFILLWWADLHWCIGSHLLSHWFNKKGLYWANTDERESLCGLAQGWVLPFFPQCSLSALACISLNLLNHFHTAHISGSWVVKITPYAKQNVTCGPAPSGAPSDEDKCRTENRLELSPYCFQIVFYLTKESCLPFTHIHIHTRTHTQTQY